MSLFSSVPSIPKIKPAFNLGCLFDIPTGKYHIGTRGESILNAGMGPIVSIAGPGNSFKSVIASFFNMTVAERIKSFRVSIYDTENSFNYDRINNMAARFPKLSAIDHSQEDLPEDDKKFIITSSAEMLGDVYFKYIKDAVGIIKKDKKIKYKTTPFINSRGEPILILPPSGVKIDSLSELKVTANEDNIVDKNEIGESGNNILYMRQGSAKKQLITQLPNISTLGGMFFTMVAHVGDEFDIGGMFAPKKHKLTHAKRGSKIIGTTKSFEFINTVLYEIFDASLLKNKEKNSGVLYPVIPSDREGSCVDLLKVTMKLTRNKMGQSGVSVELIISQREGVLPHLSQFHYIKTNETIPFFGISGNNTTYHMDLLPDLNLSRTKIRELIDTNPKLCRALEITSDMLQIKCLWAELPDNLMCTPSELYDDLIKMGYDWDILLNTRSYWIPLEDIEEEDLNLLTTMDLLRMRAGLYKPYWQ